MDICLDEGFIIAIWGRGGKPMSLESMFVCGELAIKLSITLTHSFVSVPPKKLGTCVLEQLGSNAGLTLKCVCPLARSNIPSGLGFETLLSPAG